VACFQKLCTRSTLRVPLFFLWRNIIYVYLFLFSLTDFLSDDPSDSTINRVLLIIMTTTIIILILLLLYWPTSQLILLFLCYGFVAYTNMSIRSAEIAWLSVILSCSNCWYADWQLLILSWALKCMSCFAKFFQMLFSIFFQQFYWLPQSMQLCSVFAMSVESHLLTSLSVFCTNTVFAIFIYCRHKQYISWYVHCVTLLSVGSF